MPRKKKPNLHTGKPGLKRDSTTGQFLKPNTLRTEGSDSGAADGDRSMSGKIGSIIDGDSRTEGGASAARATRESDTGPAVESGRGNQDAAERTPGSPDILTGFDT